MHALIVEGIDALYGESHVLHSVSFGVGEGKVLALLGRNGAGKTTCMNTVIGFLAPRRGSVRLFGEPIERLSPESISRKGVGLVPQGRRVFPTLTVKENLAVASQRKDGLLVSIKSSISFRASRSAPSSTPAPSPAASSRCSPSGAP